MTRETHSYVVLEISKQAYEEIQTKLIKAGYSHCMFESPTKGELIDMNGIALKEKPQP